MVSRQEVLQRLQRRQVIGLYSPVPGSGKSVVAKALEEDGFVRVPFAGTLKAMIQRLLEDLGYSTELALELVQERKEVPLDALDGVTTRHLMQTLGTEWGRQRVRQDLWLRCWQARARAVLAQGKGVVADDVRFANEAQLVTDLGGSMVMIRRPQAEANAEATVLAHASEGGLEQWPFTAVLWNRAALSDLIVQARQLIKQLED